MKYSIRVSEVANGSENLKGIATVTLGDSFKLTGIKIYNSPEKEKLFISMPSYKTNQVNDQGEIIYKDIFHPITPEFREALYSNILDSFAELHDNQAKNSYIVEVNDHVTTMPEFSVRVTPYEKEGSSIKGLCSVTFEDSFVVNNISIHEGKDGQLFVSMPNYKTSQVDEKGKTVYKDIAYPATPKFREKLLDAIVKAYDIAKEQLQSQQKESVKGKLEKNKEAVEKKEKDTSAREKEQPSRDDAR
ncbi:MAG: septation protein SpoVG family protein [Suilimivivens sp.]